MNISSNSTTKLITFVLGRFHAVLFVIVVFGGLSVAVLILSGILQSSSEKSTGEVTGELNALFDQDTVKRIEKLKSSEDSSYDLVLPEGRINPFVEEEL